VQSESGMKEEYRIAKADYEAFKQKYAVKKELE